MTPKVTFIVPTYKRPELLLRCLTSIKSFFSLNYEIIVVDDSQYGEGAAASLSVDATYIRKSSIDRRGLAANRNIGLSFAKGEFVVFIDDDDFYLCGDLQTMIMSADESDIVCSNYFTYANESLTPINIGGFHIDDMLVCNRLPVGSFAVRRSAIKYGFDEEMAAHEDWDFLLRNMYHWKVKYFECFSIVIDKTNNQTSSHQAMTKKFHWLDFLSVYSRFPCPRLKLERSKQLSEMGINLAPEMLSFEAYVNQRVY